MKKSLVVLTVLVVFLLILIPTGFFGNLSEKITGKATYDLMGLVAHYDFEGNVNDSVGRNPGKNHWVEFVEGKFGQAGKFEWGQYVEIPNSKDFDKWKGFTYSAWVNPESYERDYQIIMGHDNPYFGIRDTGRIFAFTTGAGSIYGESVLEKNQWHHILVTWTKEDYLKVYLNGELEGVGFEPGDSVRDTNPKFYIGKKKRVEAYPFSGLIDEVKIWNKGLNESEVKEEYESYLLVA